MSSFNFFGETIPKTHAEFGQYLRRAHEEKHHPLCLCKSPGIPMYVSRASNTYILKRMPNRGALHHSDCDSYAVPAHLSGRGLMEDKAITENHDTGLTSLKLAFPLTKSAGSRDPITPSSGEQKTVQAETTKLTIRALLEYLYEDAGLTRWSPRMKGKRNWHVVRHNLVQAAQNKMSHKNAIAQRLLVPEFFSVEKKGEIAARRRHFFASMAPTKGKLQFSILIGEVKAIETARFGGKLIIKHMPDMPIYMAADVFKRVGKVFASQIAMFEQDEDIHLLTIMTFYLSASGNPQVETISFMTVDSNWLPFDNICEKELMERLVTDNRYFLRSMRYNLSSTDVMATAILTDTKPDATAFYIVPLGATEAYYDELDQLVNSTDTPSHIWDTNDEVAMTLPPHTNPTVDRPSKGQTEIPPRDDLPPNDDFPPVDMYADEPYPEYEEEPFSD